jgi:hypothetical protein
MGRHKKDVNHSPPKNKLVQEPEGNEENEYLRNPMKPTRTL